MKIRIIIFSIIFSMTMVFFNKKAHAFEFGIGPKIGVGVGFYTGEEWYDYVDLLGTDNRAVLSFSIGLIFDMSFFHKGSFGIGIQPELLYTYTGGGVTEDSSDYDNNYLEEYYHTLQVPLLLKLSLGGGNGRFLLLGGPDILVSFNKRADVTIEGEDVRLTGTKDLANRYTIGLTVGMGYESMMQGGKLQLSVTYSTYFTGFGNGNAFYKDAYNNMLHVSAAYSFTLIRDSKPKEGA